jgi:hypothetical protein
MKIRYVAALTLAIWYLLTPPDVSHRAWLTPPSAEDPELWKAQHKAEVAIMWNPWVLLVPHVKGMMPMFILDKHAPAGVKGVGKTGICVRVDQPQNVRWVEGWVPSQLDDVTVVVEADPRLAW